MTITAQIRLAEGGFLAELPDGQRIERGTLDELAAALHAAGVTGETSHCGDWRDGAQILGAGQQIALKAKLRRLAGLDHVGVLMIRLADYPILAQLAKRHTAATRLDERACRMIYERGLPEIDLDTIQTDERELIEALGLAALLER